MRPYTLTHKTILQKRNCITTHQTHQPPQKGAGTPDARCSQPLSTNQTPHPTTKTWGDNQIPISGFPHSGRRDSGPVASKPNSVSGNPSPANFPYRLNVCCAPDPDPLQIQGHLTNRPGHRTPTRVGGPWVSWCSLERRCSSRTFRYGCLVTTSSLSPIPPSPAPSH